MSKITIRIYLRAIEEFAHYFKTSPDRLGLEQVRQYQAHLFPDRKLGAVSVAQQLSALRFFFLKTVKRPWMLEDMPVPKKPIRLA
jgi:integrase/recombinase XerD